MSFVIYYSGEKTVEADAPSGDILARDIQVILQDDPKRGPYFQSNSDYYVWRKDHWQGVDEFGLYDYLLDTGWYRHENGRHCVLINGEWKARKDKFHLFEYLMTTGLVLFGRTISNEEYQAIFQQAKVNKRTWRPWERKP